jgi:hypothetical protein
MQDPVSIMDVQKLTERVAALNLFIPRVVERSLPFFPSSQKFQELSMVRSLETSFSRTQRLLVEYD